MSSRSDLTRWNRAGLDRFEYVDGNAAEYLEILRQRLATAYADPDTGGAAWLNPPEALPENEAEPASESLIERQMRFSRRQQRIVESYHQDRRDWAWEISRSVARACHVLTGHADAYANESFLGTATQWDNVRRMVELLDYYPAPPSSATTRLVFTAKGDTPGTVPRGFQVKYTPPEGGPKVVFETLEDLAIDPALNALRPRDWDKAQAPAALGDIPAAGPSALASAPAIYIQGVGPVSATALNLLRPEGFRIVDFLDLDPASPPSNLAGAPFRDWCTKARLLVDFAPSGDWSTIGHMTLTEIGEAGVTELQDLSGNNTALVEALKWDVDALEVCLDDDVLATTPLADLLPTVSETIKVLETAWYAKRKPKLSAGDFAMVYREEPEAGQAVTVDSVDPGTGLISLESSPLQQSWFEWNTSEALLKVSPRFKRKSWLNGDGILRTAEAHGLTPGAYIGWKNGEQWQYAQVTDADRRSLRVDYEGELPDAGTELFLLRPLAGDIVADGYEVVVVLAGPDGQDLTDIGVSPDEPPEPTVPDLSSVFTLPDSASPVGPAISIPLLPPGGLPDIGSFLIPSPFLPVDLVKAAVKLLLKLGIMQIPSTGEPVFEGIPPEDLSLLVDLLDAATFPEYDADGEQVGDPETITWVNPPSDDTTARKAQRILDALSIPEEAASAVMNRIDADLDSMGPPLALRESEAAVAEVTTATPRYLFDGNPGKLSSGDWLVVETQNGLKALQVNGVEEFVAGDGSEYFSIEFLGIDGDEGSLEKIHGDFRDALVAEGANINLTTITGAAIELEGGVPAALGIGDSLLLTADGEDPLAATVQDIVGDAIVLDPPASGFTLGHLQIHGNVVRAGHGETRPAKILGSGDAAKTHQSFVLAVEGVSFTPDATMDSGVAAAVNLQVSGRSWQQVSTLNDSTPGDAHYAVRMTEEGYLKILFGDGEHGRRLPTGQNNVRVTYRVGTGLSGNVPAGALGKPVKPHNLVAAVQQPVAAAGGGNMEDTTSLRENAPETLLALKRAVSLSDFSNLAMSRSNVWHARARRLLHHDGKVERISVVVLPAGGAYSADIETDVRDFLQNLALPGVQVRVEPFVGVRFHLAITARVATDAFVAEDVRRSVTAAIKEQFALQRRKLGEPLYLSEVVKVVESVQGVENSICVLNGSSDLRVIRANGENRVLYLDVNHLTDPSSLTVTVEAYQP